MHARKGIVAAAAAALIGLSFAGCSRRFQPDYFPEEERASRQAAAQPAAPPYGRMAGVETVAEFHGPMPTGVTVSRSGRIFVNFPRWGDPVEFTAAELRDGKPVP